LGNASLGQSQASPVRVAGLTASVIDVAAGDSFTCAVTADGQAKCWGANIEGQLGNGSRTNSSDPVAVHLSAASAVATGFRHACAIDRTGSVWCWGANTIGQLGNGMPSMAPLLEPVRILDRAQALSASVYAPPRCSYPCAYDETCALVSDQTVHCWGAGVLASDGGVETQPRALTCL
jgi:alpha-tubulin suppressor-like RCC1 family protein